MPDQPLKRKRSVLLVADEDDLTFFKTTQAFLLLDLTEVDGDVVDGKKTTKQVWTPSLLLRRAKQKLVIPGNGHLPAELFTGSDRHHYGLDVNVLVGLDEDFFLTLCHEGHLVEFATCENALAPFVSAFKAPTGTGLHGNIDETEPAVHHHRRSA